MPFPSVVTFCKARAQQSPGCLVSDLMGSGAGTRTFPLRFTVPLLTEGSLEGVRTKWCQADV